MPTRIILVPSSHHPNSFWSWETERVWSYRLNIQWNVSMRIVVQTIFRKSSRRGVAQVLCRARCSDSHVVFYPWKTNRSGVCFYKTRNIYEQLAKENKKCLKFGLESIVQGVECVNQLQSLEKCDEPLSSKKGAISMHQMNLWMSLTMIELFLCEEITIVPRVQESLAARDF